MKDLASLIILAYERPEFLHRTMESLLSVPSGFPMEIIVHNDGSKDPEVFNYLIHLAAEKKISMFINNCGPNQGIEKAVKRGVACSNGDYIFKLDTDLEFTPNWLAKAVEILKSDERIGAVGLVDYRKYDPSDERFHVVEDNGEFLWVEDFVSSAYGFTRKTFNKYGYLMSHDGWHLALRDLGMPLALEHVVNNYGFGKSIYVGKDGKAVNMDNEPLKF